MWTAPIFDFWKVPNPIQQLALLSDLFGGSSQYVTENAVVGSFYRISSLNVKVAVLFFPNALVFLHLT
jgi:hypothetical protein